MTLFSDTMCLLSGPTSSGTVRASTQQKSPHFQSESPNRVYPLTKSQEGMWVEFQTDSSSTKYNLTLEWDLFQKRPVVAPISNILTVIHKLTERHAVLRCMITTIDGKPHLQEYLANAVDPDIRIVHREQCAISEKAMKQIIRQPFSLSNELPARWIILQDTDAYRVYLVGHHIVVDGQSMTIISKEFLELLDNPGTKLPSPTAFSAMHMIERAWASSSTYAEQQNVLLRQIRNQSTAPWPKRMQALRGNADGDGDDYRKIDTWSTFPKSWGYERLAILAFYFESENLTLSAWQELRVWSQLFKTSWFRVATALVGLLVVDKTRPAFGLDETLSIGFGGRPRELDACVGQFANALPVKLPLWQALHCGDGSFKALVSAFGKNISAVKKAELFPAIEVARASRSLNINYRPPRVAVTYSPKLANSECRLFPVEGSWDLFFCFLEYEEDVKLGVIYNPQTLSASVLREMKLQFDQLSALSKTEGVMLRDMLGWLPKFPSLPVAYRVQGLQQSSPCRHVHQWFDAHAESNPDSLALHSSELNYSMTYGELYISTEQKAKLLQKRGVHRGDKVLVHLRRGFAVIEWSLAILKCGAAFVYLDPEASERQKAAVVGNCKPTLIVDDALLEEAMLGDLEDSSHGGNESGLEHAKYSTSDDDLAYVIYTSGSTGEPKGVMVEHGNVASFVQASKDVFGCGYGSRVLQLASFSFDASTLEWTTALCTGGCLCFAQCPEQLVGEYLAEVIEENDISFMQVTPTALETLPLTRDLPSLRQISIGGEAGSRELFAKWHSRVNLVNAYGPTEAAIAVSFHKIDREDALPEIISVGPANANTAIYICAEGFGPVLQPGSQGEVCIAGPQVARGYCENPDQTSRSFKTHSNGVRMYRTGDRGMLQEDGSLVVLGRMDRELKVRGFRVAPEEVEKAILDAEVGVTEASIQLSQNGLEMVAFIAPETISVEALLAALKGLLPKYKVPSHIHRTASLPKNVSGKIDHKAVRMMRSELSKASYASDDSSSDDSSDGYVIVEHSDDEEIIGWIWADVLGVSTPPAADINFFDIGGHSLLVPKLHEQLKATFPDRAVRLVDMFHQSTIKKQAALFGGGSKKKIARSRSRAKRSKSTRNSHPGSRRAFPSKSSISSMQTPKDSPTSTRASSVTSVDAVDEAPSVAIVGIAGRFPGASNADEFYQKLVKGYSGIVPSVICPERKTLPGNIWVPSCGALDNIEDFDNTFWHLSREEATDMDPQQRLFMEVVYEALRDAGIDPRDGTNVGTRTGLFVGSANHSYHLHTESVVTDNFIRENRGFVAPSISARTAYHLNVSGPNVTVQTNCASSTVALALAFDSLRLGRCDVAIVGGVSVQLFDGGYITQNGQIFSPRGVCSPFDAKADGTVPADAVTAIVLKRHSAAEADGTPVYAKIVGTGLGSDGALEKAGYQVPSPRGQAEVIKSAWNMAGGVSPERLRYAEIHGSGTPIGDALELEGLALAMKELGATNHRFTVGSTKGNIGNTQHSSGLVSLIKLCKSIQGGVIPATKGLDTPNPMINPGLPIDLAMQKTPLVESDILAVSAAGWGGVNSHIVLAFPEERLHKKTTTFVPADIFMRQRLEAPRLQREL